MFSVSCVLMYLLIISQSVKAGTRSANEKAKADKRHSVSLETNEKFLHQDI